MTQMMSLLKREIDCSKMIVIKNTLDRVLILEMLKERKRSWANYSAK